MEEPYRLRIDERPAINGLLLDAEMERVAAESNGQIERAEVQADRIATLRRLLAAFPVPA